MAQGNPVSYALSIDWASVGGFPDNGDTVRLTDWESDRGRETTFVGDSRSNEAVLARNKVGSLTLTLDNWDHRYDAYNALSPLYPNVQPGKVVRLQLTDDFNATYTIFTGTIDSVVTRGYVKDPIAVITCSDLWKQLSQEPLSTTMHFNDSPASAMREIIGYVVVSYVNGAPVFASQAGLVLSGSDNYPYIWGDEAIPYQVLHDLTEMDGGHCWVDVNGVFTYYPRVVVQNQIPTFTLDQSQLLDDPAVIQPWDNLKNTIQVATHDRTPGGQQIVWSIVDHAALSPGQALSYILTFTGANGKAVPIDPTISYPGIIFSTSPFFGIGSLLLGQRITQFIPPGGAVKIGLTVTNIDTQLGYISSLTYTANPLNDLTPSQVVASDPASIGVNGTRVLRLDYPYMQTAYIARAVAGYYLARFKDPKSMFAVQLTNRSNIQFAYDLYALINFKSTVLAVTNLSSTVRAPTTAASVNNPDSTGIVNPGFEAGSFVGGWDTTCIGNPINTNPTPDQLWSVTGALAHSGTYSAVSSFTSALLGGVSRHLRYGALPGTNGYPLTVSVTPNATISISFWYNITAQSGDASVGLSMKIFWKKADGSNTGTAFTVLNSAHTVTGGWVNATGSTTSPADAAFAYIDFITTSSLATDQLTVYVDDVVISNLSNVWTAPALALAQDASGAYANAWLEVAAPASVSYTDYLVFTGFGFNFQPTDIITGVQVRIRKKTLPAGGTQVYPGGSVDYLVKLVKGGVISGSALRYGSIWSTNYFDTWYGSQAFLWGLGLTYADVNASNFGVAISAEASQTNAQRGWTTAYVDYVEMTVFTNNGAFPYAFRVVGIKHKTGISTKEVTTTWVLEPAVNSSTQLSPNQVFTAPTTANPLMAGITY